jgi:hypothetical protein
MRSRSLAAAAAAILLSGCASGTPAAEDRQSLRAPSNEIPADIRQGAEITLRTDAYAIRGTVPAPPAQTFAALAAVYADLGIPVTATDPATMTLGNPRYTVTRRLGGTRMTEYLDCGDFRGIPNAEAYTVRMDIRSTVTAEGEGSVVATVIQATARSNDGTATQPVACRTLTKLEDRIAQATMRKALGM